jgi:hypothetical protein
LVLTWSADTRLLAAALACALLLVLAGCGSLSPRFGDPAKFVELDNRSSELVSVSIEYRGNPVPASGLLTVQPHATLRTVIQAEGQGVRFTARLSTGKVLLDQYYSWDQFPSGETPLAVEING